MSQVGFVNRFDKVLMLIDNGKFWRCVNSHCTGRIKTDENDVFIEFSNENAERVQVRSTVTATRSAQELKLRQLWVSIARETSGLAAN
jgi:hypothetical protein